MLFLFELPALLAAQQTKVFIGAKIIPIGETSIENGVMIIQDGKILTVGAKGEVDIPSSIRPKQIC